MACFPLLLLRMDFIGSGTNSSVRAFSIPRFVSIVLSSYFLLHTCISKSTKINLKSTKIVLSDAAKHTFHFFR